MNRGKLILIASLLGSFVVGLALGAAAILWRTASGAGAVLYSADLERSGKDAYIKYRYGSYEVAKAALLEHAERLSTPEAAANLLTGPGAQFDLGLTYGRLALAAERAGNDNDAANYMLLATQAMVVQERQAREDEVRMLVGGLDAAWDRRLAGTP